MRSADHEVLSVAADWLDAGHDVYLVTVARTWGSSPRPPGSLLAVRQDGEFAGSVSGGCVEEDLAARLAAGVGPQVFPTIETYGVSAEQTHRFGLPCGGRLDLLVERLTSAVPVRAVLRAMDERRVVSRRVCLATGEASLHGAASDEAFQFDGDNAIKVFGRQWRLLLIGAGQLSRHVAEMALALDCHVIVCDPREEYARAWSVAGAEFDTGMPDDVVRAHASDERAPVGRSRTTPGSTTWRCWRRSPHAPSTSGRSAQGRTTPSAARASWSSVSRRRSWRACTGRSVCRSAAARRRRSQSPSSPSLRPNGMVCGCVPTARRRHVSSSR
jgi:xanthine/CO dehydrogenase XdhC/CoxF family maturation factor